MSDSRSILNGEVNAKPQPHALVVFIRNFTDMYMEGSYCGEVTGPFTVRQVINLHKLLVAPIYLAMLWFFAGNLSLAQIWGPAAGALLVCHGTYGFLWVFKDIFYGDPGWQRPCGFVGALSVFIYPLGFYYTPMFCLITDYCDFAR